MSRDSQADKEPRTQRNTDNPRGGRRQGEPSLSLSEKSAHNNQEEVIKIPKNKVGNVIGRNGKKKRDIMERSGVQALVIKDDHVRITGTEEQRTKAKTIIDDIIRVRLGKMPPFSEVFHPPLSLPSVLHTYLSASQPGRLSPSVRPSVGLSVCLSVCLFVSVSASLPSCQYLFTRPPLFVYIRKPVCLPSFILPSPSLFCPSFFACSGLLVYVPLFNTREKTVPMKTLGKSWNVYLRNIWVQLLEKTEKI